MNCANTYVPACILQPPTSNLQRDRRSSEILSHLRFEFKSCALVIQRNPFTNNIFKRSAESLAGRFWSEKRFFRGQKRRLPAPARTILESRKPRRVVTPHTLLNGTASQADFRRDLRFGAAQPRLPDNLNSLGHPSRLLLAKQSLQFLHAE